MPELVTHLSAKATLNGSQVSHEPQSQNVPQDSHRCIKSGLACSFYPERLRQELDWIPVLYSQGRSRSRQETLGLDGLASGAGWIGAGSLLFQQAPKGIGAAKDHQPTTGSQPASLHHPDGRVAANQQPAPIEAGTGSPNYRPRPNSNCLERTGWKAQGIDDSFSP